MPQDLPPPCRPTRASLPEVLDEEYCTVVFRLQGGRPRMSAFLLELSDHLEGSGTVEIVRFHVGDDLHHPYA